MIFERGDTIQGTHARYTVWHVLRVYADGTLLAWRDPESFGGEAIKHLKRPEFYHVVRPHRE
jgi:hypothetical protein